MSHAIHWLSLDKGFKEKTYLLMNHNFGVTS